MMINPGLRARSVSRPARTLVARAGDSNEDCYLLLAGMLSREIRVARDSRQILGFWVPGDICGLSDLSDESMSHDIVALSPVSYLCVSRRWLSSQAQQIPDLNQAIWREMSREANVSAAWMANIGQRRAYPRLAHLICELEARWRAAGQNTSAGFDNLGTQADIRAATGLSLVHVNKTLRKLEQENLISCNRGLKILDIVKLRSVAGFDPAYLALDRDSLAARLFSRLDASKRISARRHPSERILAETYEAV